MSVDSYLELFTTMYGWAFAGVFRDILVDTGIIFLPFLFIIIGTWLRAHEINAVEGADAAWMVRKMEVEFWTAIFVMAFCFTPVGTSLENVNLRHTPAATALDQAPATATGTNSDSTYDDAFSSVPQHLALPPWWFAVMSVSGGFNDAVRGGISGGLSGLREVEEFARSAAVEDPTLRAEVQRFYNECYLPARSRYLEDPPSPAAAAALEAYGDGDPDWMGSHAFQSDPKLYPALHARAGVPGFALDVALQDADMDANAAVPDYGRPTCHEWWTDPTLGVRAKLVKGIGSLASATTSLTEKVALVFSSVAAEKREDGLARLAMGRSNPAIAPETMLPDDNRRWYQALLGAGPDVAGMAGMVNKALHAQASRFPIIQFATLAQPLILMGIYMFLPLILVFGRYSVQIMFLGALAIFTVKLWAVLWYIAMWIDEHLWVAMYPDSGHLLFNVLHLEFDTALKRSSLNTLLIGLYLGLPLIWSGMMGWASLHVVHGIDAMKHSAITAGMAAGQSGTNIATRFVGGVGNTPRRGRR
ncbi:conjugal transfer protein TraG N-terminal domain-containing protein [Aromatoleum buckelii]|uniref:TraG N-terminal Proteobacteria domain-containing protein n=1 Tax=Aromatoleum buckelii TaxID=200254 RepID=A0ABX1N7G6_9RHOO|nr:conjugal transfer protein TraG N-terminal domain-containing protein [Aromatoleum buckelii]MCK0513233.1 conjugal transfer protein TraG N-terminal domain-containing protein [Aromatoleum buckelii]